MGEGLPLYKAVYNSERWLSVQMHRSQHKVTRKKKKQVDIAQWKAQHKSLESDLKEREVYNLSDKDLKRTFMKMLHWLKKMMCEQNENINKDSAKKV